MCVTLANHWYYLEHAGYMEKPAVAQLKPWNIPMKIDIHTICKLYIQTRTKIVHKNISQGYHRVKQNEHLRIFFFRFGAKIAKTKQSMPELHLLIVLIGISLVTNIRTKASKKHQIKCPISHFWVQLKFRFKAHFRNSVWHF